MVFTCTECNTTTTLEVGFLVKNFACPNCKTLYALDENNQFKLQRIFRDQETLSVLKVGQKGILENTEYTISGILTKRVFAEYYWTEYILTNISNEFVFLSEAEGHWILLNEIEEKYEVSNRPTKLTYNNISMRLYEYTDAEIVSAQGFFDFFITKEKIKMVEYINSPFVISIEELHSSEATFFGKHITNDDIKKAFPTIDLPKKIGVGIVQPFYINIKNMLLIFCVVSILILCSHWFIYQNRNDSEILNTNLSYSEFSNKDFISPSFTLSGGSSPLSMEVGTNVDNSWANVNIALINEATNDEVYANKDIEYYHGYEDGESWSEGSRRENFNICGVSQGKYHLRISPQKALEDNNTSEMNIVVNWNQPSLNNFWMTVLFMAIVIILVLFLNNNFEKKRWQFSDNSPYDVE